MKKQYFFFNIIPSWIIILMPVLLISGPFLSDLGISLVAVLFLINSKKNKLTKYYNNYYFKIFFVFCIILIVSSLLSNNILISLKNSLFYFRFGIFTLCFWYLLDKNEKLIDNESSKVDPFIIEQIQATPGQEHLTQLRELYLKLLAKEINFACIYPCFAGIGCASFLIVQACPSFLMLTVFSK